MRRRFDKIEVARRQLGTALQLFIDDADPVSVHTLACAGGEIADALVDKAGGETFRSIAIEANPLLDANNYRQLRSQHYNAFKHLKNHAGKERNDDKLLFEFSDNFNDIALLIGWLDFATATGVMPIEAQCFQGWFFALNPDKLAPDARIRGLDKIFSGIGQMERAEQKKMLSRVIRTSRRNNDVMNSAHTERRALLLPNNLSELDRPTPLA